MDLVNILIIVGAVIFMLALWVIVGLRHLKYLRLSAENQWDTVDAKIRKRHDLIPLFIESFMAHVSGQDVLIEGLIAERSIASKEYVPSANKMVYEHDISGTLGKIFNIAKTNPEALKDTVFLEVKSEIVNVFDEAKNDLKKYNETIRIYNAHRDFVVLKPISRIFGYGVLNIFDI
ncbi:MAG: LemA family protein [Candidatus Peregrinibacteria bacterium]|nr:LemA family protein [Candidatus Peregrinibacteria bacterium]